MSSNISSFSQPFSKQFVLQKTCQLKDGRYVHYKLKPNASLTDCVAKVKFEGRLPHCYHHAKIIWKEANIRDLITNPKGFTINIKPVSQPGHCHCHHSFRVEISRNEPPLSSNLPTSAPDPKPSPVIEVPLSLEYVQISKIPERDLNFVCFNTVWDLIAAIEKGYDNPGIKAVYQKMIRHFHQEGFILSEIAQEIIVLLTVVSEEDRFAIASKFVNTINNNRLVHQNALTGLKACLQVFQRSAYREIVNEELEKQKTQPLREPKLRDPLHTLSADQLITIADLLVKRMSDDSQAQAEITYQEPSYLWDLEAYITILEVMEMVRMEEVERKKYHAPFYDALDPYEFVSNLKTAYLAAYGKQLLVHIPDDESTPHACLRHIYHFLGFVFHLAEAYEQKSLAPLKDAGSSLYEACINFQELKADWFATLCSIDRAIQERGRDYLLPFKLLLEQAESGDKEVKNIIDDWHTHNPFFVMGLVRSLQQFIDHYASIDVEGGRVALLLLEKIGMDNREGIEGLFTVHMGVCTRVRRIKDRFIPDLVETGTVDWLKEPYSQQLKEEVKKILRHYAEKYPLLALRELAAQTLHNLHNRDSIADKKPLNLQSYQSEKLPSTFFKEAINEIAPWRTGLQREYEKLCHDEQLNRNKHFYVDAQVEAYSVTKSMQLVLSDFLKNSDKVMLLTGLAAVGKSFAITYFAQKIWEEGAPHGFVPIVVNLPTLKNVDRIVLDTLEKRGIKSSIEDLQSGEYVKILWILDALDNTQEGLRKNLYILNELDLWKGSKVIFTCRSDQLIEEDLKDFYSQENSREMLIQANICPFDENYQERFLDQFLQVCQERGISPEWTTQEYLSYIKSNSRLQNVISIPLYLQSAAETLPRIVKSHQDQGMIEHVLIDAFFCLMVERDHLSESISPQSMEKYKLLEYLQYALDVAEVIQVYEREHGSAWIPMETALRLAPHLFNQKDEKVRRMSRCCSLGIKEGRWGFLHKAFYSFFLAIKDKAYEHMQGKKHAYFTTPSSQAQCHLLDRRYGFHLLPDIYINKNRTL